MQQNCGTGNISHHTLNVFLHYLAKFKCAYIIIFDYSGQHHLVSKYEFLLTLISILWATMATFYVSFTVTYDGFS